MAKKYRKNFYAYTADGKSGIVTTWSECEDHVMGKAARYRGFATLSEAEAWLAAGAPYEQRASRKAGEQAELPRDAVYFDSGTGGGNGAEINVTDKEGLPLLYAAVDQDQLTPRGTYLLPRGATNNYGELLACLCAMKVARALGIKLVCGDSALVIDYWSKGHVSKEKRGKDPQLVKLVREAARLRKEFEADGGALRHVPGRINPADLGFHRE